MEQSNSHSKLKFEIVKGTYTVTSKRSPGSAFEIELSQTDVSSEGKS